MHAWVVSWALAGKTGSDHVHVRHRALFLTKYKQLSLDNAQQCETVHDAT